MSRQITTEDLGFINVRGTNLGVRRWIRHEKCKTEWA